MRERSVTQDAFTRLMIPGLLALLLQAGVARAQFPAIGPMPPAADSEYAPHVHDPIEIDARPIITRYKVTLIRPRRMLRDPSGNLFVADWGAGAVLRITPEQKVEVIADELNEPAGLALDAAGNLFVAVHAEGMTRTGSILRITPQGELSVFASGLSGPTALAFDAHGNLFVSNFHDNTIARITPAGEATVFAANIPSPAALAFDDEGTLYTVSSTEGTVIRISPAGEVDIMARNLLIPSDLAFDMQGHLIVANFGGSELSYVDDKGGLTTYATVPKGTIAHLFEPDGNLLILNWEMQFLMKVTTRLTVPCPHCEREIPLHLRQRPEKPATKPVEPIL